MSDRLTTAQLAKRWGLSEKWLRQKRWLEQPPPYVKVRGKVFYDLADIEKYEAGLEVKVYPRERKTRNAKASAGG